MNARWSHFVELLSPKASLRRFSSVILLLLIAISTAFAEIPVPRPRPADIASDLFQETSPQSSQCQQQLAEFADFKTLPPITGPGECQATDVVALDSVVLADKHYVVLSPPAVLRCPMAETVARWVRDDVAPTLARLGEVLRGVETLDSFDCRRRNGIAGAKISEHARANALDVRAFKLANGASIELTDARVDKSLREKLRRTACARFSTVLGNGADPYHDSHVHLDLIERSNHYKICQWDVLDVTETAALKAKKATVAVESIPAVVPLPRPRPVVNTVLSDRSPHHIARLREGVRAPLFNLFAPLLKSMH